MAAYYLPAKHVSPFSRGNISAVSGAFLCRYLAYVNSMRAATLFYIVIWRGGTFYIAMSREAAMLLQHMMYHICSHLHYTCFYSNLMKWSLGAVPMIKWFNAWTFSSEMCRITAVRGENYVWAYVLESLLFCSFLSFFLQGANQFYSLHLWIYGTFSTVQQFAIYLTVKLSYRFFAVDKFTTCSRGII